MRHLLTTSLLALVIATPAIAQTTTPNPQTTPSVTTDTPPVTTPTTPGAKTTVPPASSADAKATNAPSAAVTWVPTQSSDQMLSTNLVGQAVYGTNGEKVGDINNLVLDQKGNVVAAVIGVGGFLGIGEKDVGVPFTAIRFQKNRDQNEMHIDATKDQLKNAPKFERWRDTSAAGTRAPATP